MDLSAMRNRDTLPLATIFITSALIGMTATQCFLVLSTGY